MIEGNIQQGIKYISAAVCTFAMLGAALAVSNIFTSLLDGIARNPSAEPKMFKSAMIGAGFAEAMGLFGFLIAVLLIFVA